MDPSAFATACRNLGSPTHHAEAELALISLRSSPHAVETALEVLRVFSTDELVAFHAALLLRDAALRQYSTTGLQGALAISGKSLDSALFKSVRGSGDALLQTTAAIYKRAFLDNSDDGRAQLIRRISELMADKRTEWHALRLLLHVIWEFSLTSKSTYLGQSLEFHSKCGRIFTKFFLKDVFIFVASAIGKIQSSDGCITALDVIEAILSWPFEQYRGDHSSSTSIGGHYQAPVDHRAGTLHLRNSTRRISPGPEWEFLVSSDDFARSMLALYTQATASTEIRSRIRQIIISMACLSGDLFTSEDTRTAHAKRISQIGYSFCENALKDRGAFQRIVDCEEYESELASECLAGCVVVARALTITPPELLLRDESMLPSLLGLTVAISESCRLCTVKYDATFLGESLQSLLSVWVLWVSHVLSEEVPNAVNTSFRRNAFLMSESVVATKWATAHISKESTEEEEDEEADSEEMSDLASIARANPHDALASLITSLRAFDSSTHDSPETRAERLGFLVRLLSDVLADPDEGETPIIPRPILEYSRAVQSTSSRGEDLVIIASHALLEMLQKESARLNYVSPLLSSILLVSIRRWAASYLFPSPSLYAKKNTFRGGAPGLEDDEDGTVGGDSGYASVYSLSDTILAAFAEPKKGMEILDFLVRTACVHLGSFGSEPSVGEAAVSLLEVLSKNRMRLSESSGWREICTANIASLQDTNWAPLGSLSAVSHGELNRVLAGSFSDPNDFDKVCYLPCKARLDDLLQTRQDIAPAWISNAVRVAELFRGASKSSYAGGDLSTRVRERIITSLPDLVGLADVSCAKPGGEAVLLAVLSVFADFCECQLAFTESVWIPTVFTASKRLVDAFARVQMNNKSCKAARIAACAAEQAEELEFRAGSLNKVLRLLIALSERNTLDFSNGGDAEVVASGQEQDASGVVLACIEAVLPLFDLEMFQIGDVVESYFDLVSGMCRTRPEHVSSLPQALFQTVVSSLSFGCDHHDSKIQRWCFESISAIAELHAKTGTSLSYQLVAKPTLIFDFVAKILELVVLSADMLALDAASSALLNLVKCDQSSFAQAVEATLVKAASHRRDGALIDPNAETDRVQALTQVLRAQFEKLFEGVRLQGGDRTDRKRFASNLNTFVREVRAFVLTK